MSIGATEKLFEAGSYTASAGGFNGPIQVQVTFTDYEIVEIIILEHVETDYIVKPAFESIPEKILANQTLAVDIVTGATYSSEALIQAVKDCVIQAGGDVEALMVKPE